MSVIVALIIDDPLVEAEIDGFSSSNSLTSTLQVPTLPALSITVATYFPLAVTLYKLSSPNVVVPIFILLTELVSSVAVTSKLIDVFVLSCFEIKHLGTSLSIFISFSVTHVVFNPYLFNISKLYFPLSLTSYVAL